MDRIEPMQRVVDLKLTQTSQPLNVTLRNFKVTPLKLRLFALGMPNGRVIITLSTSRGLERVRPQHSIDS